MYISHDHYYKDISHKTLEERSKTNFDHPDSLDTELLVEHIQQLKLGNVVNLPTYDFKTHSRTPITTFVQPKPIILVEGILILTNQELCNELDIKVFVVSSFKFLVTPLLLLTIKKNFKLVTSTQKITFTAIDTSLLLSFSLSLLSSLNLNFKIYIYIYIYIHFIIKCIGC